jgi:curli biogenesis system outer membrane secretion channel CsgG
MKRPILFSATIALLLLSPFRPLTSGPAATAGEGTLTERLAEAVNVYLDGEFDSGLAITDELLSRKNLASGDSIAILEVKSIITYAKGQKYKREAYGYLRKISSIGHCLMNFPRELWPSELRDKWYEISKSKDMLVCTNEAGPGAKTIAIMEFDNFSTGKYKESLGDLSRGLADFFEYDFSKFAGVKIVERDKLDYLLREAKLSQEGKIDPATAVRVGKMLGAQMMVFGSITQLDGKSARMVVRVVNVETSEIVTTADREGKPNFVEMEKELVKDIAGKLSLALSKEAGAAIDESATSDMDAARLYSLGLKYMDEYQYEKAYDYFRKAYEKDNSFVEAKKKMEIYKPLVS